MKICINPTMVDIVICELPCEHINRYWKDSNAAMLIFFERHRSSYIFQSIIVEGLFVHHWSHFWLSKVNTLIIQLYSAHHCDITRPSRRQIRFSGIKKTVLGMTLLKSTNWSGMSTFNCDILLIFSLIILSKHDVHTAIRPSSLCTITTAELRNPACIVKCLISMVTAVKFNYSNNGRHI